MPSPFIEKLQDDWPPEQWGDVTVVLAVSGGADSVSLLRGVADLAASFKKQVVVAHVNHQLRGPDSDADAAFVAQLCREQGLNLVMDLAPQLKSGSSKGLEEAARHTRYAFLERTAKEKGARFVATGHTMEDQAETILHRIVRGTGLRGLGGIPRTRLLSPGITLIRPLLSFRRQEILTYLAEIGQDFRTDHSNQDRTYTRNRIRHDLLPRLAHDYNTEVVSSLIRLGTIAADAQELLATAACSLLARCLKSEDTCSVQLNCDPLVTAPRIVVCELFVALWTHRDWPQREMGYARWNELAEMAQAIPTTPNAVDLPGNIHVRREGAVLQLHRSGLTQG